VTEVEVQGADGAAIQPVHADPRSPSVTPRPTSRSSSSTRLTAIGARPKITLPKLAHGAAQALIGTRPIYLDDASRPTICDVYRREWLAPGTRIAGPDVIEEYASTTVLFTGDELKVADTGELIITVGKS
jgi:N-methylhydantoinase A